MSRDKVPPVRLALVVPCYNEGEVLGVTVPRLTDLLDSLQMSGECTSDSFSVFVDDGSQDNTWDQIEKAARSSGRRIRGLRLSRNVGHQGALLAGLEYACGKCDAAVSLDADLQDDLAAITRMISKHQEGAELVYGVRESRSVDSVFKRTTATVFYKIMRLMGVDVIENHADFRLMSARALSNLTHFQERNLFLRGLIPLLHENSAIVTYSRNMRVAGKTKYPLGKMVSLAWNGVTSFSVVPLRLITALGGVVFAGSSLLAIYAFLQALEGKTLPGWASITVPLYLLGGLVMLSMGVVGEYIGKVFMEVKRRPRYLIDSIVGE